MAVQKQADVPNQYNSPRMTNTYQKDIISMRIVKLFLLVSIFGKIIMAS
jgi:hypothetical protein